MAEVGFDSPESGFWRLWQNVSWCAWGKWKGPLQEVANESPDPHSSITTSQDLRREWHDWSDGILAEAGWKVNQVGSQEQDKSQEAALLVPQRHVCIFDYACSKVRCWNPTWKTALTAWDPSPPKDFLSPWLLWFNQMGERNKTNHWALALSPMYDLQLGQRRFRI